MVRREGGTAYVHLSDGIATTLGCPSSGATEPSGRTRRLIGKERYSLARARILPDCRRGV